MNAFMQMLEQMGEVAMEEYGEIVVLQSCWMMLMHHGGVHPK